MASQGDTSPTFPMDIIETILSKLSAMSLLRFKAVSKSWNNLISSPRFIHAHLQRSKNSTSQHLFLGKNSASNCASRSLQKFSLLRLEDRKFQTELVMEVPGTALLCSCDGVVLVKGFSHREFLLWNPSCSTNTRFYYPYESFGAYGLCRDPTNDDFKIVIVYWKYYGVYSCKTKSWTRRDFSHSGFLINKSGLFVDGAVYWVWVRMVDNRIQDIAYFDSRDDKLKMLEKPKVLKDTDRILLVCLRDRLCVWFNNVDKSVVQIWSWDRNSWMEFMTIDNVPTPCCSFRPLYFQENKILIHVEGARFLTYCPFEKLIEEFEDKSRVEIVGLFPYLDSLVFFPIQKTLPHRKRKSTYSRLEN